jgi:hypothetical protein
MLLLLLLLLLLQDVYDSVLKLPQHMELLLGPACNSSKEQQQHWGLSRCA